MVLLLDHPKLSLDLTGKRRLVVVKPVVLAVRAAARGLLDVANLRHEFLVRRSLLLRHEVQRQGEIVNVDEALAAAVLDLCEDYIRAASLNRLFNTLQSRSILMNPRLSIFIAPCAPPPNWLNIANDAQSPPGSPLGAR